MASERPGQPDHHTHGFLRETFACSAEVADHILLYGRVRAFPRDTAIVRQGDRSAATHLLTLGRAHALIYTIEGQVILLYELGPGDFFGALGDLEPAPEEADIVAVEDASAFMLDGRDLVVLAEHHGCIGLALSRLLLRRLRKTTARMYERAALSAVGRVYAELLRQAREAVDNAISPPPILSELAVRVSTTRETASRAVNALERRGIVRRDATALIVLAPHRLEELIL
jgi:CRP/FNR family cyclic AMP-dependent transcriptional regulator